MSMRIRMISVLLIGYEDKYGIHLIFIEAKGATNWSIGQLESKGRRLGHVFGKDGREVPSVTPYFLLTSPVESVRLQEAKVPDWMKPGGSFVWMPLRMPPDRLVIERYDDALGTNKGASGWRVVPTMRSLA